MCAIVLCSGERLVGANERTQWQPVRFSILHRPVVRRRVLAVHSFVEAALVGSADIAPLAGCTIVVLGPELPNVDCLLVHVAGPTGHDGCLHGPA